MATSGVVGSEHEMVDEELRPPAEEVRERRVPFIGLDSISLIDSHPWQFLPVASHFVAAPRKFLLCHQQFLACLGTLIA